MDVFRDLWIGCQHRSEFSVFPHHLPLVDVCPLVDGFRDFWTGCHVCEQAEDEDENAELGAGLNIVCRDVLVICCAEMAEVLVICCADRAP